MKYKYSTNNKNQLVINSAGDKPSVPVGGRFSVDKDNRLIYRLNEPLAWRRLYNLPSKISFKGNWRLNSNYDLELDLEETKGQNEDGSLSLKGRIISAERDKLVFEMASYDKQGQSRIQLLKLSGSWQADKFNRITFVAKKKNFPDVLTLEGAWQINKNQQIIYVFEKTDLKRKTKVSQVLTFEGFWQINASNRLRYILSGSMQSYFDFRAQIESPNLYPKEGLIKYRLGIGLKGNNPSKFKVISLFGSWKLSRNAGLVFSMDYGESKFREMEFGADIKLNKRDEVIFSLSNQEAEPLGLDIAFNRAFLKNQDARAFLKLKNILDKKEASVTAGVSIPF